MKWSGGKVEQDDGIHRNRGGYAFLNSRMHGRGSDISEKFRKPLVSLLARHEGGGERRSRAYSRARAEKIRESKGECTRYKM